MKIKTFVCTMLVKSFSRLNGTMIMFVSDNNNKLIIIIIISRH